MKNRLKSTILYILLFAALIAIATMVFRSVKQEDPKYYEIVDLFKNEKVRSFSVDSKGCLTISIRSDDHPDDKKQDETMEYYLLDYELFKEEVYKAYVIGEDGQFARGIIEEYDFKEPTILPWWVEYIPYLIMIALFVGLWFFMMNQASGGKGSMISSFGRARAKLGSADKNKVRFSDVAGADEEKAELEEVVEYLKNPERFRRLGAKIPHGVLLMGPPGTGKTLLAKAVAGEAGVPFYAISGSDFVEMYVGVGASRVRDLFETAKKSPASIVFIDEIDAVGRHRGAGLGGGHDEREQTLNQLLVEMDGFGTNDGVIVMAATNRPDILDPALLRPGRFDRQVTVNYPDLKGREAILRVHSKDKPLEGGVDLAKVAQTTVGFTGADLANLLNEAALTAARKRKSLIGMNDIEEASLKIIVGTAKKSMKLTEEEKRKTAYHEAGHAIVAHVLPTQDPVTLISIIPTGRALGYTLTPPVEDKYSQYRKSLSENISMLLGGRVAEALKIDDISSGASNDIQRASEIARNMVMKFGMSDELGPIVYGTGHSQDEVFLGRDFSNEKNYSDETASRIDAEIRRIVDEAYSRAEKILRENDAKLEFIADFLVKYETMDEAQFKAVMEGNPTVEELVAMTDEKRRISEKENEERLKKIEEEEAARKIAEEANVSERDIFGNPVDPPRDSRWPGDGPDRKE